MVLRYFGRDGLAARIREHCRLARLFASWVETTPGWELLAPVPLSLVCFRACPPHDGESADERAARLDRFTLRLAVGNIRTTEEHVARVCQLLRDACDRPDPAGGG
jgi:aromatic-L-amino-acid decarboxylase